MSTLDEIRLRLAATSTGGPWRVAEQTHGEWFGIHDDFMARGQMVSRADAEFVAHARDDITALLAETERQRADLSHTMCGRSNAKEREQRIFAEDAGLAAQARAEKAEAALARVEAFVAAVEAGTAEFMESYERAGEGGSRRMSGETAAMIVQERSVIAGELRAALAQPATDEPRCDHPGIEHGPFSYVGVCPRCGECKFIGHGPLCVDCFTQPATVERGDA